MQSKIGVQLNLPGDLHCKHTMDDAVLVYKRDRTTFLRLLHPRLFFQVRYCMTKN